MNARNISSVINRAMKDHPNMLGRLAYYQDAHDVLKAMRAYLKKHPSHYYTSWYHRAKAVIINNQLGRKKDAECLKHEKEEPKMCSERTVTGIHHMLSAAEDDELGITINGQQITSGGKIYMPDVPIVIAYHGR